MRALQGNRSNMAFLQRAIATGKKLHTASDGPVSFSRARRFSNMLSQNEQFLRNIQDAQGWVDATSSKLDLIVGLLMDAADIAKRGADGNIDADIRESLGNKVDGLLDEMLSLANDEHIGRKVFAGSETKSGNPFSINGSNIIYSGNTDPINRKISEQHTISININGQQLLDTGMFTAMINLRDALLTDDTASISGSIDEIDAAKEKVLNIATTLASVSNNLDLAMNRIEAVNVNLNKYISDEEDVDLAEALTKYEAEEIAYKAALQSAAKIMNLSILDYMR